MEMGSREPRLGVMKPWMLPQPSEYHKVSVRSGEALKDSKPGSQKAAWAHSGAGQYKSLWPGDPPDAFLNPNQNPLVVALLIPQAKPHL